MMNIFKQINLEKVSKVVAIISDVAAAISVAGSLTNLGMNARIKKRNKLASVETEVVNVETVE